VASTGTRARCVAPTSCHGGVFGACWGFLRASVCLKCLTSPSPFHIFLLRGLKTGPVEECSGRILALILFHSSDFEPPSFQLPSVLMSTSSITTNCGFAIHIAFFSRSACVRQKGASFAIKPAPHAPVVVSHVCFGLVRVRKRSMLNLAYCL
jgi:hypothetical protein